MDLRNAKNSPVSGSDTALFLVYPQLLGAEEDSDEYDAHADDALVVAQHAKLGGKWGWLTWLDG